MTRSTPRPDPDCQGREDGRPALRVVAGTAVDAPAPPVHTDRRRRVSLLTPPARRLRHDVMVWAMATGAAVDADALVAILGAKSAMPLPVTTWSGPVLWELCWVEVAEWCVVEGVALPPTAALTLAHVLRYLSETGSFGPGSDPYPVLLEALADCGALPPGRRSRPRSSSGHE